MTIWLFAIKQKPRICEAFAFRIRSTAIVTEGQSRATDGARPNNASIVACKLFNLQGEFKFGVRKKEKTRTKFVLIFLWCGHRDLNSDGVTIRPSNVRVCLFRHDRLTLLIIWLKQGGCQGVLHLIFAKRQHFFQTHIFKIWANVSILDRVYLKRQKYALGIFRTILSNKTFLQACLPRRCARTNRKRRLRIWCGFCKFCVALWNHIWFDAIFALSPLNRRLVCGIFIILFCRRA